MDFTIPEEVGAVADAIIRFVEREIVPLEQQHAPVRRAGIEARVPGHQPADVARAASAQGLVAVSGPSEPGVATEALTIDGPGGPLPLRAYRPADQDASAPLIVFAHFGGGVIGDLTGFAAAAA